MRTAFHRQRKSRGMARAKARAYYRTHKTRIRQRAKAWRQRNRTRIKMTRKRYTRNPAMHHRIASQELEIVFSLGQSEFPGVVTAIEPTGEVRFVLLSGFQGASYGLPLDVFVDLAVFDTPEDGELFFAWADSVLEGQEDAV